MIAQLRSLAANYNYGNNGAAEDAKERQGKVKEIRFVESLGWLPEPTRFPSCPSRPSLLIE